MSIFEAFKASFQPAKSWGPYNNKNFTEWKEFVTQRKFKRKGGLLELFFR